MPRCTCFNHTGALLCRCFLPTEVCPFCGKTYKRLKSHLPHCKASSRTPPAKQDVAVNQATSSPRLGAASPEPSARGKQPTETGSQSKKSKKAPVVSSAPPQSSSPANTSSSSQSLSQSSASLPPATKRKKQKLSEEIRTADVPSSTTASLTSSPSPSLSPTISEPKNKSLRALTEAAKSKQVSMGSLEGTRSASAPLVADPLSSGTTAQTETKPHPACPSTDTKPKGASKTKASKTKKAQSLSTIKDASSSLDSEVNGSSARPRDLWLDNEGEIEDFSVSKKLLKAGSGHQARITLQDVKATLGRAKTPRASSRPSILSQIETTEDLSSKIRLGTSPVALPTGNREHVELQSVKRKGSQSKQAPLVPPRHDGSPQPAAPLLSGQLSSQVSRTSSLPHTVSMNEGLKVGHRMTGLLTISPSLTQLSSPHRFLLPPQTLPARVETLRADDGLTVEKSQLEVRKQNTADNSAKGQYLTVKRRAGQQISKNVCLKSTKSFMLAKFLFA